MALLSIGEGSTLLLGILLVQFGTTFVSVIFQNNASFAVQSAFNVLMAS